jgi:hypothetical protein
LNLDALVTAKLAAGRKKDLDAVKLLLAIQEKRGQQKDLL